MDLLAPGLIMEYRPVLNLLFPTEVILKIITNKQNNKTGDISLSNYKCANYFILT